MVWVVLLFVYQTIAFLEEFLLIEKSKWVKGKYQGYSIAFWFGHSFDM